MPVACIALRKQSLAFLQFSGGSRSQAQGPQHTAHLARRLSRAPTTNPASCPELLCKGTRTGTSGSPCPAQGSFVKSSLNTVPSLPPRCLPSGASSSASFASALFCPPLDARWPPESCLAPCPPHATPLPRQAPLLPSLQPGFSRGDPSRSDTQPQGLTIEVTFSP